MSAITYIIGVFIVQVAWSALSAITESGARKEIEIRGIAGVGNSTLKVADGTATVGDKFGIIVMTVLGGLMSPPFIITSGIIGGIIYFISNLLF
tara:strand:- start:189 stop:470 length:282 start_codon:yes stop_codon:yes gene_type:complete